eukprot:g3630.t1
MDESAVRKAIHALFVYLKSKKENKSSSSLLDEDVDVFLTIQLKKAPANTRTKPYQVGIPHTLYPEEDSEVCVFTKDPQSEWDSKLENAKNAKAIAIETLRKEYHQYKDKRVLLATYDLFLADERVLPLLNPLLGKAFFLKKRHPMPVVLKNEKQIANEIRKARCSTAFFLSGPYCAVRIAKSSFKEEEAVANIIAAMPVIADKLPKKWKARCPSHSASTTLQQKKRQGKEKDRA